MRLLYTLTIAALMVIGLGRALAQQPAGKSLLDPSQLSDVTTRCEPLPPAGTPEVAKIFSDGLQNLEVCPAGQYPRRYLSGKQLGERLTCKAVHRGDKGYSSGSNYSEPISDPRIARSTVHAAAQPMPCPPGYVLDSVSRPGDVPVRKEPAPIFRPDGSALRFDGSIVRPDGSILFPDGSVVRPDGSKEHGSNDKSDRASNIAATGNSPSCPLSSTGGYYCYAAATKTFSPAVYGVDGILSVQKPYTPLIEDGHSLAQIDVTYTSGASNGLAGTVELGWIVTGNNIGNVDANNNPVTDLNPHLFTFWSSAVYHNGSYNEQCGDLPLPITCPTFVARLGATFFPGQELTSGDSLDLSIRFMTDSEEGWHLFVNNSDVGYYPEEFWSGQFRQVTYSSWQGEVSSNLISPTTAMGNGRFAANGDDSAASFGGLAYYDVNLNKIYLDNGPDSIAISPTTVTSWYAVANNTDTTNGQYLNSFTYGGPGAASNVAYVVEFKAGYPVDAATGTTTLTAIPENSATAPTTYPSAIPFSGGPQTTSNSCIQCSMSGAGIGGVTPDGSTVFANADNGLPSNNTAIFAIDTATMTSGGPIAGSSQQQFLITIGPDSQSAYSISPDLNSNGYDVYPITKSSTGTWSVSAAPFPGTVSFPTNFYDETTFPVTVSSDGSSLYAISAPDPTDPARQGTLYVFDTVSKTSSKPLTGPDFGGAVQMVMMPDQSALYTVNSDWNVYQSTITRISISRPNDGQRTYSASSVPWTGTSILTSLAFTPDSSKLYVVGYDVTDDSDPAGNELCSATVYDLDAASGAINATIPLETANCDVSGPTMSISADGSTLFANVRCAHDTGFSSPWWRYSCVGDDVFSIDTASDQILPLSSPSFNIVASQSTDQAASAIASGGRSGADHRRPSSKHLTGVSSR